jgi:hypothetical protein
MSNSILLHLLDQMLNDQKSNPMHDISIYVSLQQCVKDYYLFIF